MLWVYRYSRPNINFARRLYSSINCKWLAIFTLSFLIALLNVKETHIQSNKKHTHTHIQHPLTPVVNSSEKFGILWLWVISTETFKLIWLVQAPRVTNPSIYHVRKTQSAQCEYFHRQLRYPPTHCVHPAILQFQWETFETINYKMNWVLSEFILIDWHFPHHTHRHLIQYSSAFLPVCKYLDQYPSIR